MYKIVCVCVGRNRRGSMLIYRNIYIEGTPNLICTAFYTASGLRRLGRLLGPYTHTHTHIETRNVTTGKIGPNDRPNICG